MGDFYGWMAKVQCRWSSSFDGLIGGIRGVLKNESGHLLHSFSIRVGSGLPVLYEILAIFYCLQIFTRSEFYGMFKLVVESDCKNVVDWIHDPASTPLRLAIWVRKMV
ncbi:hypothetical protein GQ457_12G002250 [Hibiscus cannabinus]